jgi:hypothetical protein
MIRRVCKLCCQHANNRRQSAAHGVYGHAFRDQLPGKGFSGLHNRVCKVRIVSMFVHSTLLHLLSDRQRIDLLAQTTSTTRPSE